MKYADQRYIDGRNSVGVFGYDHERVIDVSTMKPETAFSLGRISGYRYLVVGPEPHSLTYGERQFVLDKLPDYDRGTRLPDNELLEAAHNALIAKAVTERLTRGSNNQTFQTPNFLPSPF